MLGRKENVFNGEACEMKESNFSIRLSKDAYDGLLFRPITRTNSMRMSKWPLSLISATRQRFSKQDSLMISLSLNLSSQTTTPK